ncbi:MAG TPA: hypothetical protein VEC56_08330 [Candidatus Krumholzibacteria bacterium]|nr:hypothetical protein [Candidatus Krumholzibacteria bacterium]
MPRLRLASLGTIAVAVTLLSSCDDAQISFATGAFVDAPAPQIRVRWGPDFKMAPVILDSQYQRIGPFETSRSGELAIEFVVLAEGQESTTQGSFSLPLKSDWSWSVDFHVADRDPAQGCFGCVGSRSYALDPTLGFAPEYELWVTWGGNSISNPVTY